MKKFFLVSALVMGLMQSVTATPLPTITADGAYLIEANTETVLYAKNGNMTFYPASTTKVLTALTVIDDLPMQRKITKSEASVKNVPADSSHIGLVAGDQYTVNDGLHAVLMSSDNFVSYDLAVADAGSIDGFAQRMNRLAKLAGATNSNFVNPHGYHDENHYTTPHDLAMITDAAFNNPTVEKIAATQNYLFTVLNTGQRIRLRHTSALLDPESSYYNPHVVATKTGYHTPAGRCLVAKAIYGNMDLIGVVMRTATPLQFQDMNNLFDYASENFYYNEETGILSNLSYTPEAQAVVEEAINQGWLLPTAQNYMTNATWYDFFNLLDNALPVNMYFRPLPLESAYYRQYIKKSDLATFIYHFLNQDFQLAAVRPLTKIIDIDNLSVEQKKAIYFCVQSGIMPLSSSKFMPNQDVTYEEAIAIVLEISRFIDNYNHFSVV